MAPPAVKRRKLSHDSDEESNDGATDPRLATSDDASSDDDEQSDAPGADVDMDGESQEENDDEEEDSGDDSDESVEEAVAGKSQPRTSKEPKKSHKEPRKGPLRDRDMAELTGAYTGEVYKSNIFKLQVDELLEQIRPKHGKKEAAAEKALRDLKGIIEKIPAREPAPVSF